MLFVRARRPRMARSPSSRQGCPCRSICRPLGWDDVFAPHTARSTASDSAPGRVLRADRGVCTVLDADRRRPGHPRPARVLLHAAPVTRPRCRAPGTGCVLRRLAGPAGSPSNAVLPRRTALIRRTADKDSSRPGAGRQHGHRRRWSSRCTRARTTARIERLLALAWESGAQPVVVLTKADMVADPAAVARQLAAAGARGAGAAGQRARAATGSTRLRPLVAPGRTLALLGRSGAGKSTLVNALAGATVDAGAGDPGGDGKGRHTTAYRALVPVPGGGAVLDTPGIRGVGLLDTGARPGPGVRRHRRAGRRVPVRRLPARRRAGLRGRRRRWPTGRCRRAAWRAGASCATRSRWRAPGRRSGWPRAGRRRRRPDGHVAALAEFAGARWLAEVEAGCGRGPRGAAAGPRADGAATPGRS